MERVQFRGAAEDREGDLSEPWLQMLVAFVKWRLEEVYKLELMMKKKKITSFEINSVRRELKDILWQYIK